MIAISSKGILGHPAQLYISFAADAVPQSGICSGLIEEFSMAEGASYNVEEKFILKGPVGSCDKFRLTDQWLDVPVEIAKSGIEIVVLFEDAVPTINQVV